MTRRRGYGDRGAVGGVEVLPFGVLVFVGGGLLVANLWAVLDAKIALTAAAREAVRVYVESPDAATAAAAARRAAHDAYAGHGRDAARLTIELHGDFARCAPVRAEASVDVPVLRLPFVGAVGDGFTVTARHGERVDPYRADLDGEAVCD